MSTFRRFTGRMIALAFALALFAFPVSAATPQQPLVPSVCYGIADGFCVEGSVKTQAAPLTALPADFAILTDRTVTLTVTLPKPAFGQRAITWSGQPVVAGGSGFADALTFTATCANTCVIAAPFLLGAAPGDVVYADAILRDPDATSGDEALIYAGRLALADVIGEFNRTVPMLNPADNPNQRTFVRIIAPASAATVALFAIDDSGVRRGPLLVSVPAGGAVQVTPTDIENGNPSKGFATGLGTGTGKHRLELTSGSEFRAFGYGVGISLLSSD